MQGTAAVTMANQVVTLTADKNTEQRLSTRKELGSLLIIVFELLDSGAITLAKRKYQEFMRYLNKHFSLTPEQNKALNNELFNMGERPAPLFEQGDISCSASWAVTSKEQLPVD